MESFLNTKRLTQITIIATLSLLSTGCFAADPITQGRNKAEMCAGCHGKTGKADLPIYPNLAGQNALYLEMTLKAYRDESRKGAQASAMYAIAQGLSDEDIKQLSAYYESLK